MEQIVIIFIIGLISLVNWLMKRSAEIREQRREERKRLGIPEGDPFHDTARKPERSTPPPVDPSIEMRKLMEALGIPMEEPEPPVFETAAESPAPELPPLPTFEPPPEPAKTPKEKRLDLEAAIPAPRSASPLLPALHSHEGIRQAIVLREILGPPKAFTS